MRDPDQIYCVLNNLLDHPALKQMLRSPQVMTTYLQTQGWAELPPGMEEMDQIAPDSQEAAEAAELAPIVEEKLADLELTHQETQTLKHALIATCQDCRGTASLLLHSRPAQD